jgi:surface protein
MFSARQTWIPVDITPMIVTANVGRNSSGGTANTMRINIKQIDSSNVVINWGDGNSNTVTSTGIISKTYANNTSLKTISILGPAGFAFTDANRVIDVTQWGSSPISNAENMFSSARSITNFTASDAPVFTANTNAANMFLNCLTFNTNLGSWNVTNVSNMRAMFSGCWAFNNGNSDTIKNWNVGNVTDMAQMFNNARVFDQPVGGWTTDKLTNVSSMFAQANVFNNGGNSSFAGWANAKLTTTRTMFNSAPAFNQPLGEINVSNVTDMSGMFAGTTAFNNGGNNNINNWNTANVTLMTSMFTSATAFNQPIGNWNTSNVTNIQQMFQAARAFNQNINSWDISKIPSLASVFQNAEAFNQPLGNWNTSGVVNMTSAFQTAGAFNQDIGNWNMSSAVDVTSMFINAANFNNGGSNSINNWNTSKISNTGYMFFNAASFNQPIGGWNLANATSMIGMFYNANAFNNGGNTNINNMNVANCRDFSYVFHGTQAFNQSIAGWNMSNSTSADFMFQNAASYNQNLSSIVTGLTLQPAGFSSGANATWVASKATTFPFLAGGTVRINT